MTERYAKGASARGWLHNACWWRWYDIYDSSKEHTLTMIRAMSAWWCCWLWWWRCISRAGHSRTAASCHHHYYWCPGLSYIWRDAFIFHFLSLYASSILSRHYYYYFMFLHYFRYWYHRFHYSAATMLITTISYYHHALHITCCLRYLPLYYAILLLFSPYHISSFSLIFYYAIMMSFCLRHYYYYWHAITPSYLFSHHRLRLFRYYDAEGDSATIIIMASLSFRRLRYHALRDGYRCLRHHHIITISHHWIFSILLREWAPPYYYWCFHDDTLSSSSRRVFILSRHYYITSRLRPSSPMRDAPLMRCDIDTSFSPRHVIIHHHDDYYHLFSLSYISSCFIFLLRCTCRIILITSSLLFSSLRAAHYHAYVTFMLRHFPRVIIYAANGFFHCIIAAELFKATHMLHGEYDVS